MTGAAVEVGAATADLTPPVGVAMGGYGARTGVSDGVLDPLLARVVTFTQRGTSLVLVVCDLLGVSRQLVEPARALVAERHGIPPEQVLIAATHTHSGPAALRSGDDPEYVALAARAVAGAVGVALRGRRPATLKLASARVTSVSRNRRAHEGPIQPELQVLLAAPPGRAEPVATLLAYACHATVLEHGNLRFSADFPGAANRLVERSVGGVSLYLQGACGDINPVWMAHDAAEVERIGGIVGAAAVRAVHELRPLGEGQRVVNLSWSENLDADPAPGTVLDDVALAATRRIVELPRRVLDPAEAIDGQLAELEAQLASLPAGDVDGRRRLAPRHHQLRMEKLFRPYAPSEPGTLHKAEVQVLRLSPRCAVVGLPGELFVEIGDEIARRSGVEHVLVAGYANNYLGYVPTAAAFPESGYEVGCARFEPEAAAILVDAALDALAELGP